jgi:SAM-dependent methyltransferase
VIPAFDIRVRAWSNPPVDDVGYISSAKLLKLREEDLLDVVRKFEESRYLGWRNYENRWREVLGLDSTHDKVVLDYGCGVGIEALQYARAGNDVIVADISRDNVRLAMRILALEGFEAGAFQITEDHLMNFMFSTFDVIHCAGVLHHIPDPIPVVEAMSDQMAVGGELRLMLYSDKAWRIATDSEPPEVVTEHPRFNRYWTHWDPIGGYADWYDESRILERFGHRFDLACYEPLTENGAYVGAVLVKK